jgi:hypothetical protein
MHNTPFCYDDQYHCSNVWPPLLTTDYERAWGEAVGIVAGAMSQPRKLRPLDSPRFFVRSAGS